MFFINEKALSLPPPERKLMSNNSSELFDNINLEVNLRFYICFFCHTCLPFQDLIITVRDKRAETTNKKECPKKKGVRSRHQDFCILQMRNKLWQISV